MWESAIYLAVGVTPRGPVRPLGTVTQESMPCMIACFVTTSLASCEIVGCVVPAERVTPRVVVTVMALQCATCSVSLRPEGDGGA